MMEPRRAPEGTQAVVRAIRLLKAFSHRRPAMTLAELSASGDLSKSTAHRLLAALESESLVARDPSGWYSLGPAAISLGTRALLSNDLRVVVQPSLKSLATETGETATLEILSEKRVLIIGEVSSPHLVCATPEIGTRWPLHATSTGKALLANLSQERCNELLELPLARLTNATITDPVELARELEEVRSRGFATADEELEDGAAAVAAVLCDPLGEAVGAISVGGPVSRMTKRKLVSVGRTLRQLAHDLSRQLSATVPS
jgi:DNA-binding IclR family transcriptional regulator